MIRKEIIMALNTAKNKYNKQNVELYKKLKKSEKTLKSLNKKKASAKTKKAKRIQNKKILQTKSKIKTLKSSIKKGEKKSKIANHKSASLKNMKATKRFKDSAYLMPVNPNTNKSYAQFFVTDISNPHSINVSSKSVEHGMAMATTTQKNLPTISVAAKVGGYGINDIKTAQYYTNKILLWADSGAECVFHSRQFNESHVLISDVTPQYTTTDSETGINAINLSFTLTVADYFDTNPKKKKKSTKNVGHKSSNKGSKSKSSSKQTKKYVKAKNGDTYIGIARKKGVSVSHLKQLNKYADTKIPIGAKIYY